jgi:hypothetical protein
MGQKKVETKHSGVSIGELIRAIAEAEYTKSITPPINLGSSCIGRGMCPMQIHATIHDA